MPAKPPPLLHWNDVPAAIGLLTRLPVKVNTEHAMARGAAAAWAYPLVGLVVGGLASLVGGLALLLTASPPIAAGLALATQVIVTGAMHEDGLADCADGFWGGWDRKRRLAIMKDSQVGTYGVLALVFAVGLAWVGLKILMEKSPVWWVWLTFAAVVSRHNIVAVMASLPHARPGGLSSLVGRPSGATLRVSAGIAVLITLAFAMGLAAPSPIIVFLVAWLPVPAVRWLAKKKIGGQTGDVLGGAQAVTFLTCLITAVAIT
ncbi:MAG: adenosylcobinamide-GDP ribazoletransferase [Pseudomonadota bacterium]